MRILVCSNVYPPRVVGGAELMAHEQALAYARQSHNVRVFAGDLHSSHARYTRINEEQDGIPVTRIALVAEDYSPEYLNFIHPVVEAHFADVLRDFQPDVVHCHNLPGLSVKLATIARVSGARVVCTFHDFWGFCPRNTAVRPDGAPCRGAGCCQPRLHDGCDLDIPPRLRRDFLTLALAHVDHFVTPSRFVAERYRWSGLPAERIAVIPNGIDTDRFRPASPPMPHGGFQVLYAGYFGAHKGVSTLMEAIGRLPAGIVNLTLAGEGPEEAAYRTQAQTLGIANRVRFLGRIASKDMPGVYAASDVLVLPSIWDENQPVCLMEAMAAGLPVLASRKGGVPELVEDGANGFLFAAGDAGALADRLSVLIADPAARAAMGRTGRQRVAGATHDARAAQLLALFERLVARPTQATATPGRVVAVMGNGWADLGRDDSLPVPSFAGGQRLLYVPLDWVGERFRFAGVLLAGQVRLRRRTRYRKTAIMLPSWLTRIVIAGARRVALPRDGARNRGGGLH